jgi:coproporphyrinogen III oxidase
MSDDQDRTAFRDQAASLFRTLQREICDELEQIDQGARFRTDEWERPDPSGHGGGGATRVFRNGDVFEQAGVNFSAVHGTLPAAVAKRLLEVESDTPFFATGVSLVIHPRSPMIPTTHANFRYFDTGDRRWFGGGMDLTPYYLFADDARHFHQAAKDACDRHDPSYYPRFKQWCDEYFFLPHRGETRGIGGIFYDYLGKEPGADFNALYRFVDSIGHSFAKAYFPIVRKRLTESFTEQQREFQLVRRGRYVEFNLLYDRGTHFGLQTKGRTESILMSLPPLVRWEYDHQIAAGSPEAELLQVLRSPRGWVE